MRIRSVAHPLLLLGLVLVGPFDLSRAGAAEYGGFLMTHSNGSLTAPLANFTVTNLNDSGSGSLRQAVVDSNTNPGADVITFSVTGTITLTTGELLITDSVTILGPDATVITVSGNNASRVYKIAAGVTATISGLTISNGNAGFGPGGGILNDGGTVTITNCTLSSNSAGGGGGISSFGTATITNSTLSGNSAAAGGGISNFGGTLTITNSTLSANSANIGGGIESVFVGATTIITNSTVVNNSAAISGGGIRYNQLKIKNSIVANNTGGTNCFAFTATLTPSGVNFSTDGSCLGFTQVTPAQLNLGPLTNNGGQTRTHALLAGSVAIDAVLDCTDLSAIPVPVTIDQRGVPRPLDGDGDGVSRCDVGAYEGPVVILFDLCIQDESNGYILKLNSTTGGYQFTNCAGFTLGGTGSLIVKGGIITLQDYRADRRVLARIDSSVNKGTASVQVFGQGTLTISDRNTLNNACACTVQ